MDTTKPLTIGIVAGEVSGDMLGADFMAKMNALHPNITWVGVGGVAMQKQGLSSTIDMGRLSVMGLVEVLKHLPDLLCAKREILEVFFAQKIDIFVGIDAPDFNLRLGKVLRRTGVFCVQYVSPSVWAWRENRIHNIKESTDLVLCLFPFELDVYVRHRHPAVCVGHPLLDKLHADKRPRRDVIAEFERRFGVSLTDVPVCVMAGSRHSEIGAILPLLIDSMALLHKQGKFTFVLPVVSADHAILVKSMITSQAPHLLNHCHVIDGQTYPSDEWTISQHAMNACELVLLASGTATLEALLLHRPMVVVYKVNTMTYAIAKRLVKIPYVSLPNILSNHQIRQAIVPELIQDNATPQAVVSHAMNLLNSLNQEKLIFTTQKLREDSHTNPAQAVLMAYSQNK
ncbi:lipid-A-disaccharide synthase [Moraxella oblonga]|uniref:lipid-A-disaccharide synthase n=1 Tax=Moraxella oblonga TaxID=200413 RepID=UPI003F7006F8